MHAENEDKLTTDKGVFVQLFQHGASWEQSASAALSLLQLPLPTHTHTHRASRVVHLNLEYLSLLHDIVIS